MGTGNDVVVAELELTVMHYLCRIMIILKCTLTN